MAEEFAGGFVDDADVEAVGVAHRERRFGDLATLLEAIHRSPLPVMGGEMATLYFHLRSAARDALSVDELAAARARGPDIDIDAEIDAYVLSVHAA